MPAVRVSRTTSSSTPPVSRSAAASCARGSNLLLELLEWGRSFGTGPLFSSLPGHWDITRLLAWLTSRLPHGTNRVTQRFVPRGTDCRPAISHVADLHRPNSHAAK